METVTVPSPQGNGSIKGHFARQAVLRSKGMLGVITAFAGQWPHPTYIAPGGGTCEVTAEKLADLYADRWQVEINLRHLKQTLRLDVLRCKTVAGVHKELLMIALAYNLVGIALAAAGLLHPIAAALLMVASSLTLVVSATRVGAGCQQEIDELSAFPESSLPKR